MIRNQLPLLFISGSHWTFILGIQVLDSPIGLYRAENFVRLRRFRACEFSEHPSVTVALLVQRFRLETLDSGSREIGIFSQDYISFEKSLDLFRLPTSFKVITRTPQEFYKNLKMLNISFAGLNVAQKNGLRSRTNKGTNFLAYTRVHTMDSMCESCDVDRIAVFNRAKPSSSSSLLVVLLKG